MRAPLCTGTMGYMAKDARQMVTLDPSKKKRLAVLASMNERSVAAEIRLAVDAHLERHAPQKDARP